MATAAAGLAAGLCVWAAAGALAGRVRGAGVGADHARHGRAAAAPGALDRTDRQRAAGTCGFRSLTIRTVVSQSAGAVAGLALALAGAGVWALVSQALVQRGLAVIILWAAVPLTIDRRLSWKHLRELSTFALPNLVSRCMSWGSGQLPRLILGVYLGPTRLGLFTLATRLHDVVTQVAIMPKAQVARVDLPTPRWHAGCHERGRGARIVPDRPDHVSAVHRRRLRHGAAGGYVAGSKMARRDHALQDIAADGRCRS